MNEVYNDNEFMEAGMRSWNTLTQIFEPGSPVNFETTEEFKEFYSLVIDRLFEEEFAE